MNSSTPRSVILAVVIILGVIGLAVIGGSVLLAVLEKPPLPTSIVVLGSTSIGAVAGMLASTRTTETGVSYTATTSSPTPPTEADYTTTPIVAADHPAS